MPGLVGSVGTRAISEETRASEIGCAFDLSVNSPILSDGGCPYEWWMCGNGRVCLTLLHVHAGQAILFLASSGK